MNAELQTWGNDWLGALITGGYQALALAAFVWSALKVWPRTNAATRHAVWFVTLVVAAALPFIHWFRQEPMPLPEPAAEVAATLPYVQPSATVETRFENLTQTDLLPLPELPPSLPVDLLSELENQAPEPALHSSEWFEAPAPTTFAAQETSAPHRAHWQLAAPEQLGALVLVTCAAFALTRIVMLLGALAELRGFKRRAQPAPAQLEAKFAALKREVGVARPVALALSSELSAPIFAGLLKPLVLLPAQLAERADENAIEQILRHELGHAARWDDWANLAQQIVKSALYFHPVIHWMSRRISIEREIACDDYALAATRSPRAYALFLTEFASQRSSRQIAAAPAAWSNHSQLKERVSMILDTKRNASPRLARTSAGVITGVATLVALLGFYAGPQLSFAANEQDAPEPAAEPSSDQTSASARFEHSGEISVNGQTKTFRIVSENGEILELKPSVATTITAAPAVAVSSSVDVLSVDPVTGIAVSTAPAAVAVAAHHPGPMAHPHPVPAPPRGMPDHVKAPRPVGPGPDAGLEKRLERLEQMVQSLMHERRGPGGGGGGGGAGFGYGAGGGGGSGMAGNQTFKFNYNHDSAHAPSPKEIERMHQEAARIAEDVGRKQAQIAREQGMKAREMQREARVHKEEAIRREEQIKGEYGRDRGGRPPREAIEQQREALRRELEKLEQQLRRLDEQSERSEREQRRPEKKPAQPAQPKPPRQPENVPNDATPPREKPLL